MKIKEGMNKWGINRQQQQSPSGSMGAGDNDEQGPDQKGTDHSDDDNGNMPVLDQHEQMFHNMILWL